MKRLHWSGSLLLLGLLVLSGCARSADEDVRVLTSDTVPSDETEVSDSLHELEELDALDRELESDVDLEELEGMIE